MTESFSEGPGHELDQWETARWLALLAGVEYLEETTEVITGAAEAAVRVAEQIHVTEDQLVESEAILDAYFKGRNSLYRGDIECTADTLQAGIRTRG